MQSLLRLAPRSLLGSTRFGDAAVDPYAGWELVYDAATADGYELNAGAVETINDLGPAGADHTVTQATATRRAAVSGGAFVFDGTSDSYPVNSFAAAMNATEWVMPIKITPTNFAANRNVMSLVPSSGSGILSISTRTTGRVRFQLTDASLVNLALFDIGSDGINGTPFSAGAPIDLTLTVSGDEMSILLGETEIVTGKSFPTTSQDAIYAVGAFGSHTNSGGTPSAFFLGSIAHLYWKAL